MSSATSYSRLGYLALKKETTAGTAVYPNVFLELLSEDLQVKWDHTPSQTIAGNRSANLRPIKNRIEPIEGTIELLVEPNQFGHLLTGVFGEATDSTLNSGASYQHDLQAQTTLKTYTMDIKVAGENYVMRYFGVRIASMEFSIDENKWRVSLGVMAQRAFTNARVITAASSGTALAVDQTSGLTTSDTIAVLDADDPSTTLATLTVSSVGGEKALTVSTIGASLAVDDIVVIVPQTPTYDLSNELIWSGGAQVALGTGANAIQGLGTYLNLEDFTLTITNDLEARWTAQGNDVIDRFPAAILVKGVKVEGKLTQYHQDPEFLDMLRQMEQVGLRVEFLGGTLDSNSAAAATATIETDGSDQLAVAVDSAGEAGNDYAVIVQTGTSASPSATISGKLITVSLGTTGSNNTTTAVASAIDALSGVSCPTTGTDIVTTTDNPSKIYFAGGRDANEIEKLRFDLPNIRLKPFSPNLGNDDVVQEEIDFEAYRDANDGREILVRLRNDIADY